MNEKQFLYSFESPHICRYRWVEKKPKGPLIYYIIAEFFTVVRFFLHRVATQRWALAVQNLSTKNHKVDETHLLRPKYTANWLIILHQH